MCSCRKVNREESIFRGFKFYCQYLKVWVSVLTSYDMIVSSLAVVSNGIVIILIVKMFCMFIMKCNFEFGKDVMPISQVKNWYNMVCIRLIVINRAWTRTYVSLLFTWSCCTSGTLYLFNRYIKIFLSVSSPFMRIDCLLIIWGL